MKYKPCLTHISIGSVVSPACPVHTVLQLIFSYPVVIVRTALDYNPCYFPGLTQIRLDPAWSCWKRTHKRSCFTWKSTHQWLFPRSLNSSLVSCWRNDVEKKYFRPLPEGIQQELPCKRALFAVKEPIEEEAESWKSVMFPSSTPRPCRHTVRKTWLIIVCFYDNAYVIKTYQKYCEENKVNSVLQFFHPLVYFFVHFVLPKPLSDNNITCYHWTCVHYHLIWKGYILCGLNLMWMTTHIRLI